MDKGTCPQCSGPVERQPGKRGPVPVYCSALCKSRAASARRVADGRYAAELAESASRSAVARVANARPCPYCGVPMEHPRRMQCGSDECERRFNSERNMARAREYRDRTGKWPSQRYERKPERLIDRACLNCCAHFLCNSLKGDRGSGEQLLLIG